MSKLFVIMPFGVKNIVSHDDTKSVDFDFIYRNLIVVAGKSAGFEVLRVDEISTPGRISDQYLFELYTADVVLGEITYSNANVFYELGVRQALATGPTILIAQYGSELPFDLRDQRVLFYDAETKDGLSQATKILSESLLNILKAPGKNPIQAFLHDVGIKPSADNDSVAFEQDLKSRIERAKNALQLVAVWNWVRHSRPLPPLTLFSLAEKLADEKEWAVAAEVIEVALEYRPNDFEFHRQHGWYLRHLDLSFYEEAEKSFLQALDLNPFDPETLGMLGGLYKRQERFSDAAACYQRGVQISPANLYMQVNLAAMELLAHPKEPERAIELYRRLKDDLLSRSDLSKDEWTELVLGEAQFVLGEIDAAKQHFLAAVELTSSLNNLVSPADQIEMFCKAGFRPKDSSVFATWIRSLRPGTKQSTVPLITVSDGDTDKKQDKLPVVIHLSDIHFGTRLGPNNEQIPMHRFVNGDWSLSLSEHLRNEFSSTQRHFQFDSHRLYLVISGDLTYAASVSEFREADKFLTELCKNLSIPKERVLVCPGNHDVDWANSKINRMRRFDNYLSFLLEFYGEDLFRSLYPLIQWDFRVNSERPNPAQILSLQEFPDDNLLFVSLNSCVYETEEHHYGYISGSQLRNLEKIKINNPQATRIAVLHHHIHPFPEPVDLTKEGNHWHDQSTIRDGALVEKYLEKQSFDIVLHGHKHKPQLRETIVHDPSLDSVSPLIVCGAGSCGVQSKELEHSVDNHYEVIEFLRVPRIYGADFVRVEWREIALTPGSEWVTPKSWVIPG